MELYVTLLPIIYKLLPMYGRWRSLRVAHSICLDNFSVSGLIFKGKCFAPTYPLPITYYLLSIT